MFTLHLLGVVYEKVVLTTLRDMTEKQPYKVLKSYPELELRQYPAGMQIETEVTGSFITAGNMGFGPLVRFISGNNKARQARITMELVEIISGASAL